MMMFMSLIYDVAYDNNMMMFVSLFMMIVYDSSMMMFVSLVYVTYLCHDLWL